MLYTYCFYWSTLLLSTIGDVPLPEERVEYVFVLFDYMIGNYIQSIRTPVRETDLMDDEYLFDRYTDLCHDYW